MDSNQTILNTEKLHIISLAHPGESVGAVSGLMELNELTAQSIISQLYHIVKCHSLNTSGTKFVLSDQLRASLNCEFCESREELHQEFNIACSTFYRMILNKAS